MRYSMLNSSENIFLRHPLDRFSKIALLIGVLVSFVGIVITCALWFTVADIDMITLLIITATVTLQGVVWLLIGAIMRAKIRAGENNLRILQQLGQRYEAEITELVPYLAYVNSNLRYAYVAVRAECVYVNSMQQRCKVVSTPLTWKSYDSAGLKAVVFVDLNDPYKYAVEITRTDESNMQVDVDYTRK